MEPSSVGRLAPSPTGLLHLGHARSFLIAFWHARSRGGRLMLRLEDLDSARVSRALVAQTLRDLSWLGLDWDGQPELQSQNVERISAAAKKLEAEGLAYACVCTRGELRSVVNAPHAGDPEPAYPGTCRGRFSSRTSAQMLTGRDAGLRFCMPSAPVTLADSFRGEETFAEDLSDFLIVRRDKIPAYQLAVVVDDAAQGVDEVVRGDDLWPSTVRQWQLQRALGLPHPRWFHVPLVCDEMGRRLAKRSDGLSLAELRSGGTDARAIVEWVAASAGMGALGWLSAGEAAGAFQMSRVPASPVLLSKATIEALRRAR
jgi:glutamyl-tRNA synthetase